MQEGDALNLPWIQKVNFSIRGWRIRASGNRDENKDPLLGGDEKDQVESKDKGGCRIGGIRGT